MASKSAPDVKLEIGHVLFIDVVGYSKLLIDDQRALQQQLNHIVRGTEQFRAAEAAGKLVPLPTGDGMALVFFTNPDAPVECALEISEALQGNSHLTVRMGINTGPVSGVADVNDRSNVAGAGINMAQRVMDLGDAGHILLSKRAAEDLAQYRRWEPHLHDLGEIEVKHGVKISIVNLYTDKIGNREVPEKLKQSFRKQSARRQTKRALIAGLLLLAFALSAIVWRWAHPNSPGGLTAVPEKSIAVLPFENLSDEKENAFFANGVHDEILTNLAKVADLKVISRTSVMSFRDTKRNLREIAQALGVAHIVEGSVQRAVDRVRVSAQLIDARTDTHLWAERYDRELADVFAIQSEIAQKIAAQLKAALSPKEHEAINARPTADIAAYDLYLRAKESYRRAFAGDWDAIQKEVTLLDEAVTRDPAFVPALCLLARAHLEAYWFHFDHTPARLERASKALEAAARLQPDSGEVHLSRAVFHYWGSRNYVPALAELALASRSLPNDADVLFLMALIERRQGRWEEAIATLERAFVLDPRNASLVLELSVHYSALKRYSDARRVLENAQDLDLQILRADIDFDEKADLRLVQKVLAGAPATAEQNRLANKRGQVALLQRDYRAAAQAFSEYRLPNFSSTGFVTPREYVEGVIARGLGDASKAKAAFFRARERAAATVTARPDDAKALMVLAGIDAKLDRKEEAVREGERALELLPVARDALDGPVMLVRLAAVYAEVRETDRALEVLQQTVALPNGPSYGDLRLDEDFDPLRKDPRFEKIVASLAPKETISK
jgi:TolB-like protein/cytochrome c-type biogenesis protein CcmH/NrfG